jgi:hypothetical protein
MRLMFLGFDGLLSCFQGTNPTNAGYFVVVSLFHFYCRFWLDCVRMSHEDIQSESEYEPDLSSDEYDYKLFFCLLASV